MLLLLLELCLFTLRRKRRGDAVLDCTDDPVESESQFCFRFLCAKSISRFIASGLPIRCHPNDTKMHIKHKNIKHKEKEKTRNES